MVYDLIQNTSLPAMVKDRSWYMAHLESVVANMALHEETTGFERYIFVLHKR